MLMFVYSIISCLLDVCLTISIYMWSSKLSVEERQFWNSNVFLQHCTFFCRLSLSAYLLQLLFQIFRDFLHLTSGLSCFPKSGPNGSISRADIPRTDINPRNMSFQCWKVLSTVILYVEVRSSDTDLILTFSSAKQAGSDISFWFWLSFMQIGSGSDFFTCKLF